MSRIKEKNFVFEMLSDGKINPNEAEILLNALEASYPRKKLMGFLGIIDSRNRISENKTRNIRISPEVN